MKRIGLICFIGMFLTATTHSASAPINIEEPFVEVAVTNTSIEKLYTEEDLYLLARVINAEAGSKHHTDEHQQAVASVVINRVNHPAFPNTIRLVIYQPSQYACTKDGGINKTPTEQAIRNARIVLTEGSKIPTNVVFQSRGRQGSGIWKKIQEHYFCYI